MPLCAHSNLTLTPWNGIIGFHFNAYNVLTPKSLISNPQALRRHCDGRSQIVKSRSSTNGLSNAPCKYSRKQERFHHEVIQKLSYFRQQILSQISTFSVKLYSTFSTPKCKFYQRPCLVFQRAYLHIYNSSYASCEIWPWRRLTPSGSKVINSRNERSLLISTDGTHASQYLEMIWEKIKMSPLRPLNWRSKM